MKAFYLACEKVSQAVRQMDVESWAQKMESAIQLLDLWFFLRWRDAFKTFDWE